MGLPVGKWDLMPFFSFLSTSNDSAVKLWCHASRLRQAGHRAARKTDEERMNKKASYQYPPLTKRDSIRVIELHPAMPGDLLSIDQNEAQLNVKATFEALSYEWQDEFGSVPVQCDDKQILITPNYKAAMENLRLSSKRRYLWIDAICINQDDDQERNQQVAIMADIFRAAEKVLMWLGKETDSTRAAFEVLPVMTKAYPIMIQAAENSSFNPELVGEDHNPQEIMDSVVQDEVAFEAFTALVQRTYWTRAWNFQEIVLGDSRGICISGSQSCEWTVMRSALLAHNQHPSPWHFSTTADIELRFLNTGTILLGSVVLALLRLNVTDPRDKVFASLGLASTEESFVERPVANYTITVQDVFVQATRYIIDRGH
ncbi:hypothetical protein ACHAP5_010705 [Fusarium lateritium]